MHSVYLNLASLACNVAAFGWGLSVVQCIMPRRRVKLSLLVASDANSTSLPAYPRYNSYYVAFNIHLRTKYCRFFSKPARSFSYSHLIDSTMRRLKRRDNGALNLMEDREDDDILKRYQYIILSHIWFQEDETTFPQFINGKGLKSVGYKKIHFYAK